MAIDTLKLQRVTCGATLSTQMPPSRNCELESIRVSCRHRERKCGGANGANRAPESNWLLLKGGDLIAEAAHKPAND